MSLTHTYLLSLLALLFSLFVFPGSVVYAGPPAAVCTCTVNITGNACPNASQGGAITFQSAAIPQNSSGQYVFDVNTINRANVTIPSGCTPDPNGPTVTSITFENCSGSPAANAGLAFPPTPGNYTVRLTSCAIGEPRQESEEVRIRLVNPLGGTPDEPTGRTSIVGIIAAIIQQALQIIGAVTLLVFIVGGFTWATSAGNPDRVTRGRNMMLYAVIGIIVIFSAYAVITAVITGLSG